MNSSDAVSRSNPVLVMSSVLATYQAFVGGLGVLDVLDDRIVGVLVLAGAAVAIGWGMYTRGVVTPSVDVVAKRTRSDLVVAGPAAHAPTGREVVVAEAATGDVVAPPPVEDPEV